MTWMRPSPRQSTYVYLIHAEGTPYYKLGKSVDPAGRVRAMQGACPHALKLLAAGRFGPDTTNEVEAEFHVFLHRYGHRDEWFKLPQAIADVVAERLKKNRRVPAREYQKALNELAEVFV